MVSLPKMTPAEARKFMYDAEAGMMAMPEIHVDIQVTHTFAKGVYCRQAVIPAGVIVFGQRHATEHLNVMPFGDISVFTEEGVLHVQDYAMLVSKPGVKKVGYAHQDTLWMNVHKTHLTDLAEIQDHFIQPPVDEECLGELLGF